MADNSQNPGTWPPQQGYGTGSGQAARPPVPQQGQGYHQGSDPQGYGYGPATQGYGPAAPGYGPATQSQGQGPATQGHGYGQPAQAQGYGPTASYPGQQGYGQAYPQQGYGQPGYPAQQGYQVQQGYPASPAGYSVPPATRSPLLGMISLGVVVVCGVLMAYLFYRAGDIAGGLMTTSGPRLDQEQLQAELMARMSTFELMLWNFTMLGGMAAWVCGIVATATKRGRGYGIWAIVLGVLAPIAAIAAMFVSLMPYLNR